MGASPHGWGAGVDGPSDIGREHIARKPADLPTTGAYSRRLRSETITADWEEGHCVDRRQLSTHLRALARSEFVAEREADEAAARIYHERGRELAAAIISLTTGSTLATAYLPGTSFTGGVVQATGDLVSLRGEDGSEAHVQLGPMVVLRLTPCPAKRQPIESGGPQTFIALMRQIELQARHIRVVAPTAGPRIAGALRVVASDHIVVEAVDDVWVVPSPSIAAVITNPPTGPGVD